MVTERNLTLQHLELCNKKKENHNEKKKKKHKGKETCFLTSTLNTECGDIDMHGQPRTYRIKQEAYKSRQRIPPGKEEQKQSLKDQINVSAN